MPVRIHHIAEGWSQHKQRTLAFYYDQHRCATFRDAKGDAIMAIGRPYWAWVERPADGAAQPMPVGPIAPAGWQAPWYAPEKYITRSIGLVTPDGAWTNGVIRTNHFRIDYGAMIHEATEATKAYYERAVREAAAQKMTPLPKYGQPLPFELEIIVGRAPVSPKIPEAASTGNAWILGQAEPEFNPATGRVEIIPDKKLARLIHMASVDLPTPEESEAEQVAQSNGTPKSVVEELTARMNEQAELIQMLKADMEAAAKERAEAAQKAEDAKKRMANARAAKSGTKKPSSGTVPVG